MLPELFQPIVSSLDELTFTDLVGRLLVAEARRIGLPSDAFTYSLEVKAGDEGLDGEAKDVPDGTDSVFPAGLSGFQFKAVKGAVSRLGLKSEVVKAGSTRILTSGGTYVLAWSRQLNPKQQQEAEAELLKCAQLVTDKAKTKVISCSHIAQLCERHPTVPQALGLVNFGPTKSFEAWKQMLQSDDRPFFADRVREDLINTIRERLRDDEGGLVARVLGDSGVGKSRAVAEALDTPEFRDSTFYAPTTDRLDDFLKLLSAHDQLEAVLVVDEVGARDLTRLIEEVAAASSHIKLITIGLSSPERLIPSRFDIELDALDPEAMKELVEAELPDDKGAASFVAEATEGYPQMAFEILEEIKSDRDAADLARLSQTARPRELMERTVPEEFRQALGVLSLFHSVGYRDELAGQLEEIAEHFPVSLNDLKATIEHAADRYVRLAGRRCYVRPKLVATWLAGATLQQHGEDVITWMQKLSPSLQEQFVRQLENFGSGPSGFRDALETFIEENQRFREPADFDEAAGRFLRASAAVAPEQVASSINALVFTATPEQLQTLPRRDLVWCLEYLLWDPATFEAAIESLFVLAQNESESWSNNATGEFVDSFQLYLGGTLVPYEERIEWLQHRLAEGDDSERLLLIAKAAAKGLGFHETRSSGAQHGRLEPRDWRPQTWEEEIGARRASLSLLVACLDKADASMRGPIFDLLAENTRSAISAGLLDEVSEVINTREWSRAERAGLSSALRDIRRYEGPPEKIDKKLWELLDRLAGETFEDRLAVILETKPWDLIEGEDWDQIPPAVQSLINEVEKEPALLKDAVKLAKDAPDEGSQAQFFSRCAQALGPQQVADAALATDPPAWHAVGAALSQANSEAEQGWADQTLGQIAEERPEQFPEMLRAAGLNENRVGLARKLVDSGTLPGDAFASLIYGAQVRPLEAGAVIDLVQLVVGEGSPGGVESALGMLNQWLEIHPDKAEAMSGEIAKVAHAAAHLGKGRSMVTHYLEQLFGKSSLPPEEKAAIWKELAHHSDIGRSRDHFWLIRSLIEESPDTAAALIFEVLAEAVESEYPRWAFSLEEGKLLSEAAQSSSASAVWKYMSGFADMQLRYLLRHVRWSGDTPDPVVREFVLSDRFDALKDEAAANFFNSLGVVSGPFYLAMERERDRARAWLASLAGTSAEEWAQNLVASYEERVKQEKLRADEEDILYR